MLERKHNPVLFLLLKEVGFFDFHATNSGRIIMRHQVVAYAYKGYQAYLNGFQCLKGETEVHHLNSVPGDDRPENLVYTSPNDNLILAQTARSGYYGKVKNTSTTIFNSQGRAVKNPLHYLVNLIQETIKATIGCSIGFTNILLHLDTRYGRVVIDGTLPPLNIPDNEFVFATSTS